MPIEKRENFFKPEIKLEKKVRTPRVKKPRLTKVDKKVSIIKIKLGKMTGALGILKITNQERYAITLRVDQKDIKKRAKIVKLFSCPDLEFIKQIADKLSEELKFPYNSNPTESERGKDKVKEDGFEINHSLFKEYQDHLFIILPFGSIWLEKDGFHCKRNSDKMDGSKIFELSASGRFSNSYLKCRDLLTSYSLEIKNKILKEVSHYGSFEDKNCVRVVMGFKPWIVTSNEDGTKLLNREANEIIQKEDEDVEISEEDDE